jgi:hypothetical protein
MNQKDRMRWVFDSPDDEDHTQPDHRPAEDLLPIGDDDPTVKTTALPDVGSTGR